VPITVAMNRFSADTETELAAVREFCEGLGVKAFDCNHWGEGSKGTQELAHHVAAVADSGEADFQTLYADDMPLWDKARHIAKTLYGANDIIADKKVRDQFAKFEADGYGSFPVCMAKTQYSFSTDPTLMGAPSGHEVPIREVRLSAGAEFIVVVCGDVMTMPGLPRVPSADNIRLNDAGQVEGLF
jgi:formate--tetrahydrofolate ligase